MRAENFDPLAYIERAFLDTRTEDDPGLETDDQSGTEAALDAKSGQLNPNSELTSNVALLNDAHANGGASEARAAIAVLERPHTNGKVSKEIPATDTAARGKFRKTVMSAPRPRRAKSAVAAAEPAIDTDLHNVWQALPKNVEFLCSFYDDSVTANYYRGEFKESRMELVRRLLDPELSLEETSRLLGVCPATVRRYTNRGWLAHHRTEGGQRRFRLSNVVRFVDEHGRFPEDI